MGRVNRASRIADVLDHIVAGGRGGSAVQGWSRVLTWPLVLDNLTERDVARGVSILFDEVMELENTIIAEGKEIDSFKKTLNGARKTFSIKLIAGEWIGVYNLASQELATSFRMIAQFLPSDDEKFDEASLEATVAGIRAWSEEVSKSSLPPSLKSFLFGQVGLMYRAIWDYALKGSAGFDAAVVEATRRWAERDPESEPEGTSPLVQEGKGLWAKVETVCKRTTTVGLTLGVVLGGIGQALGVYREYRELKLPRVETPKQIGPGTPPVESHEEPRSEAPNDDEKQPTPPGWKEAYPA
jgi:hypothetical protein